MSILDSLLDAGKNFIFKGGEAGLGNLDFGNILPAIAAIYGAKQLADSSFANSSSQPVGYQGGIPQLAARRTALPMQTDPNRRPGSGGRRYFSDVTYEPVVKAAQGGLMALPQAQGYYLGGPTDGMADKVPARIDGAQEAALSDGEFVLPADIVSHLGNGNSQAGAQVLYDMMERVRKARTGRPEQGRQINPNKYTPA